MRITREVRSPLFICSISDAPFGSFIDRTARGFFTPRYFCYGSGGFSFRRGITPASRVSDTSIIECCARLPVNRSRGDVWRVNLSQKRRSFPNVPGLRFAIARLRPLTPVNDFDASKNNREIYVYYQKTDVRVQRVATRVVLSPYDQICHRGQPGGGRGDRA